MDFCEFHNIAVTDVSQSASVVNLWRELSSQGKAVIIALLPVHWVGIRQIEFQDAVTIKHPSADAITVPDGHWLI